MTDELARVPDVDAGVELHRIRGRLDMVERHISSLRDTTLFHRSRVEELEKRQTSTSRRLVRLEEIFVQQEKLLKAQGEVTRALSGSLIVLNGRLGQIGTALGRNTEVLDRLAGQHSEDVREIDRRLDTVSRESATGGSIVAQALAFVARVSDRIPPWFLLLGLLVIGLAFIVGATAHVLVLIHPHNP